MLYEMEDDNDLSVPENVIFILCLQYEQVVELLGPSQPPPSNTKGRYGGKLMFYFFPYDINRCMTPKQKKVEL